MELQGKTNPFVKFKAFDKISTRVWKYHIRCKSACKLPIFNICCNKKYLLRWLKDLFFLDALFVTDVFLNIIFLLQTYVWKFLLICQEGGLCNLHTHWQRKFNPFAVSPSHDTSSNTCKILFFLVKKSLIVEDNTGHFSVQSMFFFSIFWKLYLYR